MELCHLLFDQNAVSILVELCYLSLAQNLLSSSEVSDHIGRGYPTVDGKTIPLLRMYIFCDLSVCYYSNIEVKRSFLDIYCVNCLGKLYKFSIK